MSMHVKSDCHLDNRLVCITKGYQTLRFGQLHYHMTARRAERPLLLLHQTPSSSAMYTAVMAELAADFWCIAPDTPGFGQSDPLPDGVSIAAYATAVAHFLDALNITECYLFGHHTGASVAVQLAVERPDLVQKLALSGPPLLTEAQISYLKTTLPTMTLDEEGRFLTELWQRLRRKNPEAALQLTFRETVAALQCQDSYQAAYHAVFAQDFAAQLTAVFCPVLLMAGEHDSLYASLEPATKLVQDGRSYIIPQAGTYICDERPEVVANLLREFFLVRSA